MPSVPVRFSGRAGEWFGIWIVNLLLTIITIGIFSAWAKVRRNKYFYGNTEIEGRGFDYHATGGQILIGRLIVIGAYVLFNILVAITGGLAAILLLGLPFLLPWLIIRAMKFQARNTSWSNVRFNFQAGYWDAFVTFVLLPIGVALTLYTTLPFLSRRVNRFVVGGHSLGNRRFGFSAPIGGFYMAFGLALIWTIAIGGAVAVLLGAPVVQMLGGAGGDVLTPEQEAQLGLVFVSLIYGFIFLVLVPAAILYGAMVRNVVYEHTVLEGGHRFTSTVGPWRILWIAVSNLVVVVLTLGLMLPWAQIRYMRYLSAQTTVRPNGSLDDFAGEVQRDHSAIGDAFGDIEGFDIGAAGI